MGKFGKQTPTQSVILDYNESRYQEAVNLYKRTKLDVYDWQLNLLKAIMATDEEGLWTHQKFGYSLPRRNGKTEIVYILEIWALHQGINIFSPSPKLNHSTSGI